ncbi:hypothetical protein [Sporichthya sp.]|uniref:hypothetical protein n=1 Tax=Sporichthya sp. TaxID=65475 RepID=UPI00182C2EFA|nr:hypothetical protein [Sporichthya sp.]MBA3743901.1 hypothetical protein [Sporichthya sp.]
MTRASTGFLILEALLIGGWAGLAAIRRRVLNRGQVLALMALQLMLLVQAAASLISLAAGHDAAEPGTHVVYALGSLLLLPLLVGLPVRLGFPPADGAPGTDPEFVGGIEIRPPSGADSTDRSADRFRAVVAALACISLIVMLQRMWITWRTGVAA